MKQKCFNNGIYNNLVVIEKKVGLLLSYNHVFLTNVKMFLSHLFFHTWLPRIFILLEEYMKHVFYPPDFFHWDGHLYKILSTKMSENI